VSSWNRSQLILNQIIRYVTHSTLPLWKVRPKAKSTTLRTEYPHQNKKDVTITYTPIASAKGSPEHPVFDDLVEYRSQKSPPTKTRSRVEGIDTFIPTSSPSAPPTRYKWRGRGWLMIASSRWQVLGYSRLAENGTTGTHANAQEAEGDDEHENHPPTQSQNQDAEWALTYFEKTLFTPAGMDIYARTPLGLPEAVVQDIIAQAKAVGGDVGRLAEKFFEVQRSAQ
jgi:hypothetical protein